MRIASPHDATAMPAAIDDRFGCARIHTSAPNTNPRATRRRASPATSRARTPSDTIRSGLETPLHCIDHLGDFNVEQAHATQAAAAQMMALADGVARDGHVAGRHRTVARRPRRAGDADERGAD